MTRVTKGVRKVASEAVDLVDRDGVENRRRQLLDTSRTTQTCTGMGAAAVIERDGATVVVGHAVGAQPESLGQRTGEAHQEAARVAHPGRLLGDGGIGALLSRVPALGRELAPFDRQHPFATEPHLAGEEAVIGLLVAVTG